MISLSLSPSLTLFAPSPLHLCVISLFQGHEIYPKFATRPKTSMQNNHPDIQQRSANPPPPHHHYQQLKPGFLGEQLNTPGH